MESLQYQPPGPWYLMTATRYRVCSWAEVAGTSWWERGQAFPPGRGAQRSVGREEPMSVWGDVAGNAGSPAGTSMGGTGGKAVCTAQF